MSEGFDGDFMSDLHGMQSRNQGLRQDRIQHEQMQDQIADLREEIRDLKRPKGPPCPYCGGALPMVGAELCVHCGSQLSWVKSYPCKRGEESEMEARVAEMEKKEEERRKKAEAEFERWLPTARARYSDLQIRWWGSVFAFLVGVLVFFAGMPDSSVSALLAWLLFCGVIWAGVCWFCRNTVEEIRQLEAEYGKQNLKQW